MNADPLIDSIVRDERRRRALPRGSVCVDCGEVSCLPTGSVSIKHSRGTKPDVISDVTEVLLKGHCGNCM